MKKATRLLDEVPDVMRLHHDSIRTERAYCDWIERYMRHHRMASREDLKGGEEKITGFPTHLAVEGRVAPSTLNQAMNALVFLCKKVLKEPLDGAIKAVRAPRKVYVPVVMTREEQEGQFSTIPSFSGIVASGRGRRVKPPPDAAQQVRQAVADLGREHFGEAEIHPPDADRKSLRAPAVKGPRQ